MIRVVIVEDDGEAADLLEGYIKRYAAESGIVFMIDRFDNAITFLENYDVGYDIVFMDIEMEDLDGVSAARLLRKRDRSVTLIFVTNMAQFAIKGYEVDALDFIVKPVKYYDFAFRLKKAVSRLNEKEEQYLPVSIAGGGVVKLTVSHIKYVEVMKHRIVYHTEDGDFETYGTLKEVEGKLPARHFSRCNSCYLINLKFVASVCDYTCDVAGEKLRISQPRKKEFMKALSDYIGGGLDV